MIVAYVPSFHRGYAEFFAKHDGPIYLLSPALIKTVYPKIERDVRAIPATAMAKLLRAQYKDVRVLTTKNVAEVQQASFIMPEEDISHLVADKYFAKASITFVPAHLRWDGWGSAKEVAPSPDRIISRDQFDREMIRQATVQANKSPDWWRQVGVVVTKNGKILLAGYNRPNPTDGYALNTFGDPRSNYDAGVNYDLTTAQHGEAYAIGRAAAEGIKLRGATIYVTTFPCPTCAKLIASAGFSRVCYADGYVLLDAEEIFKNRDIELVWVRA